MSNQMKDEIFCGNCKKQYKNKLNWKNHFQNELVLASNKPEVVVGSKIPNICYKTNDPQICAKTLEKAVHDYNEALKTKHNAKYTVMLGKCSSAISVELSKIPKANENTEAVLSQEEKENDQIVNFVQKFSSL